MTLSDVLELGRELGELASLVAAGVSIVLLAIAVGNLREEINELKKKIGGEKEEE